MIFCQRSLCGFTKVTQVQGTPLKFTVQFIACENSCIMSAGLCREPEKRCYCVNLDGKSVLQTGDVGFESALWEM